MGTGRIERRLFRDRRELSRQAARLICTILGEAVQSRGSAGFVLAGGTTPKILYPLLASQEYRDTIPWGKVDFFWGDERHVPPDHEMSNYRMARETLLDRLPVDPSTIHAIPTQNPDPSACAQLYENMLRSSFTGPAPSFDVLLLGMGTDGHIASLFPGTADDDQGKWVAVTTSPAPPHTRLSLTLPVINASRNIIVLVSGRGKSEIVGRVFNGPKMSPEVPASMISPEGNLFWFLDRDAASALKT